MSAFICSDKHFQAIADYAESMGAHIKAQNVADILKKENVKSYNHRYSEKVRFSKVKFDKDQEGYSAADVFQLVNSLMYQSCEHPDYQASPAHIIAQMIREHAANRMTHQSQLWAI